MSAFEDKIEHFRWSELDELRGTLHVWQDHDEQLVLFTEDETGRTFVLADVTGANEQARLV
jgi:hypothetical protein